MAADLTFNYASGRAITTSGGFSMTEQTFASLPASPAVGTMANVSDSTVATVGGTVAGGGSNHVLARWNGSIWKVVA